MTGLREAQNEPGNPAEILLTAGPAEAGFTFFFLRPVLDTVSTATAAETIELLQRLGVDNPHVLIRQARDLGSVDVVAG